LNNGGEELGDSASGSFGDNDDGQEVELKRAQEQISYELLDGDCGSATLVESCTHSVVGQSQLESGKEGKCILILRSNISLHAVDGYGLLASREPASGRRVVGQDKDRHESNKAGDGTFDYEEPTPRLKTVSAVQALLNARRDEAREGAGKKRARVEEGGAEGELALGVPSNEDALVGSARSLLAQQGQTHPRERVQEGRRALETTTTHQVDKRKRDPGK
jgi:hypothetical protein